MWKILTFILHDVTPRQRYFYKRLIERYFQDLGVQKTKSTLVCFHLLLLKVSSSSLHVYSPVCACDVYRCAYLYCVPWIAGPFPRFCLKWSPGSHSLCCWNCFGMATATGNNAIWFWAVFILNFPTICNGSFGSYSIIWTDTFLGCEEPH